MESRINKHNGNKGGLWIALIFLFVTFAKAQTTYPITDPRNPNCPCHKYQKLAEEEFKNLLAKNNAINTEKNVPIVLASNKHVGISEDAQGKLSKIINDDKHDGISDDGLNKKLAMNDNPIGNINQDTSTPLSVTTKNTAELNGSEQKMSRSSSVSRSPQYTTTKHWKGKRKKHTSFYKQMKRIFYVGGWGIWKGKRVTNACFHWK